MHSDSFPKKDSWEVKAPKKIIAKQKKAGASVSKHINDIDGSCYERNSKGYLVSIDWANCGLRGKNPKSMNWLPDG